MITGSNELILFEISFINFSNPKFILLRIQEWMDSNLPAIKMHWNLLSKLSESELQMTTPKEFISHREERKQECLGQINAEFEGSLQGTSVHVMTF